MKRYAQLLALVLVGCTGGDADRDGTTVRGRITDADGAQGRFAGSGSLEAVTQVRSRSLLGGPGAVFAESSVGAQGGFTVDVPAGGGWVLIEALDARGAVLGAVVVEPGEGDRDATPLDTESSVEAEVFVALDADPDAWPRTRAWIDTRAALAVKGASTVDAEVQALAHALSAATAAEAQAWADLGVSAAGITDARLRAAAALSAELYAEEDGAYAAWIDAFDTAAAEVVTDVRKRAEVASQTRLAFRATLDAEGSPVLADATAATVARAEARAWTEVSEAVLAAAGATQAELDAAASAGAELEAQIAAAGSTDAVAQAVDTWRLTLVGSGEAEGSLLGAVLGADALVELALDAAVEASLLTAAAIDAAAVAAAEVQVEGADFDALAVAEATTEAYAAERELLREVLSVALAALPAAEASVDLVITAQSGFRGL